MTSRHAALGFTQLELLVVIATIAVLAALLLPVLAQSKRRARQIVCVNHLRQINLGARLYSDEANDAAPTLGQGQPVWFRYRELLQTYLGLNGPASSNDTVFACPADTFYYRLNPAVGMELVPHGHWEQSNYLYSSYEFNGGNEASNSALKLWGINQLPGIGGVKLANVRHPDRTVLIGEAAAWAPYSWHRPRPAYTVPPGIRMPMYNDSRDVLGFVDGHAGYVPMYWNHATNAMGLYTMAFLYDPPAGYDYQWSPD